MIHEASRGCGVVGLAGGGMGCRQRGRVMERGLPLQAKRALLCQLTPSYREGSRAQKREVLETVVQLTGSHRRYAMWLLNHAEEESPHLKAFPPLQL